MFKEKAVLGVTYARTKTEKKRPNYVWKLGMLQPECLKKIGQNTYLGAVNTAIQTVAAVAFLIPPAAMREGHSFKPARLSNSNH